MKKRFQIVFLVGLSIFLALAFWAKFEKKAKIRQHIQATTHVVAVFIHVLRTFSTPLVTKAGFRSSLRLFM